MSMLEADLSLVPPVIVLRSLLEAGVDAVVQIEGDDASVMISGGGFVSSKQEAGEVEETVIELLSTHRGRLIATAAAVPSGGSRLEIDLLDLEKKAGQFRRESWFRQIPSVAVDMDAKNLEISGSELRLLMQIDGNRPIAELTRGESSSIDAIESLLSRGYLALRDPSPSSSPETKKEPLPQRSFGGVAAVTMEDEARTTHLLQEEAYTIGRTSGDIQVDDPSVSGTHAQFRRTSEGYVLEDAGSRNGSFVNGEKVASKLLRDGDRIRLGTVYLTYSVATDGDPSSGAEEA